MKATDRDTAAKKLWDYLQLHQQLVKSDGILALGSQDLRMAEWGSKLLLDQWGKYLVMSGGIGRLTNLSWQMTEAEKFAEIARNLGVQDDQLILEKESTNTKENIEYTARLLSEKDLATNQLLVVCQPYMQRRTQFYFVTSFPDSNIIFSAPELEYEQYPNEYLSKDEMINIMVGEVIRLDRYPKLGWIPESNIPETVMESAILLKDQGFAKYLV